MVGNDSRPYGSWSTACRSPIFEERYHVTSNFAQCRYYMNFKWPYFRTAWGYSHMIGHIGSPTSSVHADMTLTWFKVKVKVTELLSFRKLHFSRSISSAILAWSSKLTVDYDSMVPSLQLFGATFLNFSPIWRSRDFEDRETLTPPESTWFHLRAAWV